MFASLLIWLFFVRAENVYLLLLLLLQLLLLLLLQLLLPLGANGSILQHNDGFSLFATQSQEIKVGQGFGGFRSSSLGGSSSSSSSGSSCGSSCSWFTSGCGGCCSCSWLGILLALAADAAVVNAVPLVHGTRSLELMGLRGGRRRSRSRSRRGSNTSRTTQHRRVSLGQGKEIRVLASKTTHKIHRQSGIRILALMRRGIGAATSASASRSRSWSLFFGNTLAGTWFRRLQRLITPGNGSRDGLRHTGPLQLRLHLQRTQLGAPAQAGSGGGTTTSTAPRTRASVLGKEAIKVPIPQQIGFITATRRSHIGLRCGGGLLQAVYVLL